MQKRTLGNSGIEIAPLVLGGNVFGWTAGEQTSFRLLDSFVDSGFNAVDTADAYSRWVAGHKGGESETIIGKWLKARGNREKVVIATKVGSDMGQGKKDLSRNWIMKAAEDSLRRLQTDYIDLYQSHWDDLSTPVEETLEAYSKLVQQGKVRAIGASNLGLDRLRESFDASRSKGLPRYETLQPNYNLYDRNEYETSLETISKQEHLGVIPYFSLASGFLTGKYRSEADLEGRSRGGFVKKYLNERGYKILAALDEVSAELGCKPAQASLAWLIARPSITAPIASATSVEQLQELLQATRVRLSEKNIKRLDDASA